MTGMVNDMSGLIEQVTSYARENPGIVACACVTVLLIAVTQVVLTAPRVQSTTSSLTLNRDTTEQPTSIPTKNEFSSKGDGVLTTEYLPYPLLERRTISHNTRVLRFGLPHPTCRLGLPIGRHVSLRVIIDGAEVRRPYTPISNDEETQGYFELLIKVYAAPHGLMSRHLESLRLGDTIDVRGPLGKFTYEPNSYRRLLMVCGGTGITPMWQVFTAILNNPHDHTQVTLVFANITEDDILLRHELDELASSYKHRFSVFYVLNNPPPGWMGGVGFVTRPILDEQFGPPKRDSLVLMCGPPPMNKAMKQILGQMGYPDNQIFKF